MNKEILKKIIKDMEKQIRGQQKIIDRLKANELTIKEYEKKMVGTQDYDYSEQNW